MITSDSLYILPGMTVECIGFLALTPCLIHKFDSRKQKTYERNKLEIIRENNGKSYSNFEKVTTYTMSYSSNVEY